MQALLIPLVLGGSLAAEVEGSGIPSPDVFEPDNTFTDAKPDNSNGCTPRTFHTASDEDWYVFYLSDGQVFFQAYPDPDMAIANGGTGLTLVLYQRLADGTPSLVETLVEQADDSISDIERTVTKGFYYLRARQCRNTVNPACAGAPFPSGGSGYCLLNIQNLGLPNPGLLRGTIRDSASGQPVPFALVETSGNSGTLADPTGFYSLADTPGDYMVDVFAPGYELNTFPMTLVDLGVTEIDVALVREDPVFGDGFE